MSFNYFNGICNQSFCFNNTKSNLEFDQLLSVSFVRLDLSLSKALFQYLLLRTSIMFELVKLRETGHIVQTVFTAKFREILTV